MTTMTINPENWITDAVEINIEGNTVEVNGETLELVWNVPELDRKGKVNWDFYRMEVHWEGRKLCTLIRFGDDTEWESWSGDLYRDHKNPHVLAAIMACNLI